MSLPSNISYGNVIGQFLAAVADGSDEDKLPDGVAMSGTITFMPSAGYVLDYSATPNPVTIVKTAIVCTLDSEGYLCSPYISAQSPPSRGVTLVATDDPDLVPVGWTWTVIFNLTDPSGNRAGFPNQSIQVPTGATVDLTTAANIASSGGVIITKGEKGDAGAAGGVDKWTPNTNYAANKYALSPLGAVMYSKTARVSGSTFDMAEQANWQFQGIPYRGWLPLGTDFDTMKDGYEGLWSMPSTTYTDSYVNWPSVIPRNPGQFLVTGSIISGSSIIWAHDIKTYGNTTNGNRHVERITASSVAWNSWKELGVPAPAPVASPLAKGLSNQSYRDAFAMRRGGRIGTNGIAAVALRFDHGAVNYRDKVLPKLQELGLPSSLVINPGSGRLALAENSGVTWADYNSWAVNSGMEAIDHGMDHIDATTSEALKTQLVDSKALLQSNMPTSAIELFAVPGVGGTNMGGWTSSNTPDHFTEAYEAARLVLGSHAYSTGMGYGIYRNLDGVPTNGETHWTMDATQAASDVITRIQVAQSLGAGLQLMLHPSQIDTAGNITTAILHEILTWIATERDAGRLLVLTLGGLLLADKSTTYRDNLIRDPNFVNGFANWAGSSGWTAGAGYAQSNASAGLLTQSFDGTNRAWATGAPRLLTAKFTSVEGAVARLSITHAGTGLAVSKDVTLTAGQTKTVYLPFVVPLGATLCPISVGRVSGGTLRVENLGILAV